MMADQVAQEGPQASVETARLALDKRFHGVPVLQGECKESEAERAAILRDLNKHEDILQNHRFTWFSGFQALLFAALGLSFKDPAKTDHFFILVISCVGAVAALVSFTALRLSDLAYRQMMLIWENQIESGYHGIPLKGYTFLPGNFFENFKAAPGGAAKWRIVEGGIYLFLMPSRVLPIACFAAWVVIFFGYRK